MEWSAAREGQIQFLYNFLINLHLLVWRGYSLLLGGAEKLQHLQDIVQLVILDLVEEEAYKADSGDDNQSQFGKFPHFAELVSWVPP